MDLPTAKDFVVVWLIQH